ncbi:carbapenem self-resistance protein CarG family protein [Dyella acidisoli]|uniref:Uncharacterized protein n=1 Tax=Dyella acidisoli TaxID=1867834 RepID=A0ABQ5XTV8_9GAMM|nr:hypothetical protein [Dyella acidisoli]GLQ95152.1 hypothetical protein GCM10007901_41070 [Dyella acidisoli]
MSMKIFPFWLVGASVFAVAQPALAGQFGDARPVPLTNGFNHVTLDGHAATVIVADRENYNAHGFSVATIYMEGPSDRQAGNVLNIVPAFPRDSGKPEILQLTTSGGADCVLHDYRLLTSSRSQGAWLVIAERDFGQTYVDAEPVHFDVYRLQENKDGSIGRPPVYFQFDRRIEASKPYCDVDDALGKELGIISK